MATSTYQLMDIRFHYHNYYSQNKQREFGEFHVHLQKCLDSYIKRNQAIGHDGKGDEVTILTISKAEQDKVKRLLRKHLTLKQRKMVRIEMNPSFKNQKKWATVKSLGFIQLRYLCR